MSLFGLHTTAIDITIPRTNAPAKLRLLTRGESFSLKLAMRAYFAANGLPLDAGSIASLGVIEEYNNEQAVRHLAIAVRDPVDPIKPYATLETWRDEADEELIKAVWQRYQDLEAELDPNSDNDAGINDADLIAMTSAAKKKQLAILRSYGSRTLAIFSTILAEPPATSEPPTSSPG